MTKLELEDKYYDGKQFLESKEYGKALEVFLYLANEHEYAISCNTIAQMYFDGIGVEKSESEAYGWWEKAAKFGHVDSQYFFGKYEINNDDIESGLHYMEAAANQNHADAAYFLARNYYHGNYTAKDAEKSVKYYAKASKAGNKEAKEDLVAVLMNTYGRFKGIIKLIQIYYKK